MPISVGILTVSDRCSSGEREDKSGPLIASLVGPPGYSVVRQAIVADSRSGITNRLLAWSNLNLNLILTTGGTGFAPRDVTPEATKAVIEREAPGLAELMRAAAVGRFPRAALSRGIAGIRRQTLIINLPGSPGGVRDGIGVLLPLLPHAVEVITGQPLDHETPGGQSATVPSTPTRVTVMETNIDDLSPEFYEVAMERLFAAGALDVFLTPIQMKKARPATLLTVIAPVTRAEELAGVLFSETSTYGIRYREMDRYTLNRTFVTVETSYGPIRIKAGAWKGCVTTVAPEYDDVRAAAMAANVPARAVYDAALAAYDGG